MEFKCPGRGGNNQRLDFDKSKMHVLSNFEVSRGKKNKAFKESQERSKRHIKQVQ